jgi:hypothetical protein
MQRQVIGGKHRLFPIDRARDVLRGLRRVRARGAGRAATRLLPGEAERVLAPLRGIGNPIADEIRAVDYVALQRSGDSSDRVHRASTSRAASSPPCRRR